MHKISDVVEFQNGYAFKSKDFVSDGHTKVVKIKELKDGLIKFFDDTATVDLNIADYGKYIIEKDDILIALTGDPVNKPNPKSWVGRASIYRYDEVSLLNQRVCKVIPNERLVDRYFLYYYLIQYENFYNLASKATGSASQANISTKTIGEMEIDLPDLETQKKIGQILSHIDRKIEVNNKLNRNLEKINKNLYNEWFINFKFPNEFEPDEFIIVDGVEIPSSWSVVSLGDICDISSGKRPSVKTKEQTVENKIPIIGANGVMAYTNAINIDHPILIIGRVGTLGAIQRYSQELWASDNTLLIRTNYINFIQQYLSTVDYTGLNRGSTQPLITQGDMKKCRVIMPTKEVMEQFERIAQQNSEAIERNSKQSENLSILRDALLPKLMSGELDVSELVYE